MGRDIKRIGRICRKLEKVWSGVPSQRLGQLLENYIFFDTLPRGGLTSKFFYREDDVTEDRLDALILELESQENKREG